MKSVDEIMVAPANDTIDAIVTDTVVNDLITTTDDGAVVEITTTETPEAYIKEDGDKIHYAFIMYDDNGNSIGGMTGTIKDPNFRNDKDYVGKLVRKLIEETDKEELPLTPVYYIGWAPAPGIVEQITLADYE